MSYMFVHTFIHTVRELLPGHAVTGDCSRPRVVLGYVIVLTSHDDQALLPHQRHGPASVLVCVSCVPAHSSIRRHARARAHTHNHIHIYIHTYMHAYIHAYIHT